MGWAGVGAYFAGVGLSAYGRYQEGKAAKQAHDYNAKIAEQKADYEESQSRQRWKRLIGQQTALYAKAGVDISSGSPLLVLSQQAAEGELEALNIRYAGRNEAELQKWYGKQAKKAGTIAAASTLLTGGAAGYSAYYGGYGRTSQTYTTNSQKAS